MTEFKIYKILVYDSPSHLGDAVIAAPDENRALSLLEQEIGAQFKKVGLDISSIKIKVRGKVEETSYTTNQEGVIYASCSARDSF